MSHIVAGSLVLILAAGSAAGQAQDTFEVTRSIIQSERRSIVADTMKLDETQASEFWPLYDSYRDNIGLVNERSIKLLEDYAAAYETLTDSQAGRLMDEWLDIESVRQEIREKWVRRFSRRLPQRVVARFFQLDNKLDTVVRAELARIIPLAR